MTYDNSAGYEAYMGAWSRALAPMFLDFAGLDAPGRVLDVGCGTGILIEAVHRRHPGADIVGVDPSPDQLVRARKQCGPAVTLKGGNADRLPFDDDAFDACLSLLVLQELKGPQPLRDMRRVTRPGGIVAACQWDFARMPVIVALTTAIVEVAPETAAQMATVGPDLYGSEADLVAAWTAAGMTGARAGRSTVSRTYTGFGDLWTSLQAGGTPSTMMLAVLDETRRQKIRARLVRRFPETAPGELVVSAQALVVTGRA